MAVTTHSADPGPTLASPPRAEGGSGALPRCLAPHSSHRSPTSTPATSPPTSERGAVRLPAALGRAGREPDRDAGAVPFREAGHRHRPQPPRALSASASRGRSLGHVAAGRSDGDGDRYCRVRRRRAWTEPAVRNPAAARRPDYLLITFGILGLQARGFRPFEPAITAMVGLVVARLPVRDAPDRPVSPRLAAQPSAGLGRPRLAVPGRRDPRRHRDAARDLPALGSDQVPHALPGRPRAQARAAGSRSSTC